MAGVRIEVDVKGLGSLLKGVQAGLKDLTPAMRDIGERMRWSVEENFRRGGRPKKWRDLAPATKRAREKASPPTWPGRILIVNAVLKNSINVHAERDSVTVGTADIRGRIHQLGGKAGRGHRATIPARPFLVVQKADERYAARAISRFLEGR
jgi:phage virion morphogenesis protein